MNQSDIRMRQNLCRRLSAARRRQKYEPGLSHLCELGISSLHQKYSLKICKNELGNYRSRLTSHVELISELSLVEEKWEDMVKLLTTTLQKKK